jgi:Tol biopolymer transport system component
MSLSPAGRLGPYEIVSLLGQGGMGEVYLARDTRLGRDVAIKALPDAFAHDPERLARFEREARLLASLKHPNIAAIYGLEEADGQRYLVLEYVAGATLAERLAAGPLPLDEALDVCTQIAAGVEAAHESGVVHRDLKPANVKLTPAGEVKVLDFGLAKSGTASTSDSGLNLSHSPTVAVQAATSAGVILGTAAYMSPEQARGRPVDRRTDIWSFGCVLYECLTGRPLHSGETVSDLIARILEREPDWKALPPATPARLRELIARCLRKDARERLRDIGDARIELAEIRARGADAPAPVATAAAPARPGREWLLGAIAAIAVLAAVAAVIAPRFTPHPAPLHARFLIEPPRGNNLILYGSAAAISPDGATIALIAGDSTGTSRIWLRPLDATTARPIGGTDNAIIVFWSPDSRTLAFFADGKLHTIPAEGGTRRTLADAPDPRGGSWGVKGQIVFAPIASGPLMSVPGEGGDVTTIARPDSARHEVALRFPVMLPDGEHYLCVALPRREGGEHDVLLGSLHDAGRKQLFRAFGTPAYAGPGALLYSHRGQLMRQACDIHGRLSGKPVRLGDAPSSRGHDGMPVVSASLNGVLLSVTPYANTRLTWVDRGGRMLGVVPLPPARYAGFELSPDGRRAVVERGTDDISTDLVMVDLERGLVSRFVSGSELAAVGQPLWSPDGSQVLFGSFQNGTKDLWTKRADGAGDAQPFYRSDVLFKNIYSWSPDGRLVAFEQPDARTGWDVWALPVDGDRKPIPIARTPINEDGGWISPDGRWIAIYTDETGRSEVYVMPFPGGGPRYQVSTNGASACAWRSDGRELMIVGLDGSILVADVDPGPPFHTSKPRLLFRTPPGTVLVVPTRDFSRFLMTAPAPDADASALIAETGWWR